MTTDKQENDWFKEFQQVNKSSSSAPAETKDPSSDARDRRKFARFEVDEATTVLYREGFLNFLGLGKDNKGRVALDLSTGGARVCTSERLTPGTRVKVRIRMDKYNDTIEATGEVRWCHQDLKDASRYEAGVQFVNLDPAQAKKIALMRDWFTSPQYKAVRATKQRDKDSDLKFPS